MYNTYSSTRNDLNNSNLISISNLPPIFKCVSACLIAALYEATFCTPLERCQAILQDSRYDKIYITDRRQPRINNNLIIQVLKSLKQDKTYYQTLKSWYRGMHLIIARNTISSTIYFSLRDYYKQSGNSGSDLWIQNESLRHFLFGTMSGALGCTTCYAINTLRIKQQTEIKNYQSLRWWINNLLRNNSHVYHRGFYYGWRIAVVRGSISWGITNVVYEYMNTLTLKLGL